MSVKVIVRAMPIQWLPDLRMGHSFREALYLFIHLLKPASLAAFSLGIWRIGADLGWTSDFIFMDGLLSRWQPWMLLGVAILSVQSHLARKMIRA